MVYIIGIIMDWNKCSVGWQSGIYEVRLLRPNAKCTKKLRLLLK